jgi:excisionase family DNA binding protein
MTRKFMRISEASETLNISTTTIRRLIKAGVLPAVRVGRQIRIDRDRLREWLAAGGGQVRKQGACPSRTGVRKGNQ